MAVGALAGGALFEGGRRFRTGKSRQKRAAREQQALIQRQNQQQQAELAEVDDELARQRLRARSPRTGRRSLINPQGLKNTLG